MELVSVAVQDCNSKHLTYVPENRSSPRIDSNRKIAIEKLEINYKTQK